MSPALLLALLEVAREGIALYHDVTIGAVTPDEAKQRWIALRARLDDANILWESATEEPGGA